MNWCWRYTGRSAGRGSEEEEKGEVGWLMGDTTEDAPPPVALGDLGERAAAPSLLARRTRGMDTGEALVMPAA